MKLQWGRCGGGDNLSAKSALSHVLGMRRAGALVAFSVVAAATDVAPLAAPFDCSFAASYPRSYVAYRTATPPVLDGTLDDPAWLAVNFTDKFVDISTATPPRLDTRVKLRYDEKFLYVGAQLQETQVWAYISSTCHCLDPVHDQVIYHDNDFEIFVDADGSNHYYKETEVRGRCRAIVHSAGCHRTLHNAPLRVVRR